MTTAPAPLPPSRDRFAFALDAAVLLLAVMSLARLAQQAAGAQFFTDECFHAHVASRIAATHRLPVTLPAFYGGLPSSYPPLFHLLGAGVVEAFGAHALRFLNVGLWAALLAALFTGLGSGLPRPALRAATLLAITNHWLALHAVRLYAEMPFALLLAGSGLVAFRFARTRRTRDALALGALAGLLALTKPAGAIAIPLLAAAALFAPRERRQLLLAAGAGMLIAASFLVRNQILYGSALYPLGAPGLDRELWALTLARYGATPARFFARVTESAGPWMLGAFGLGLVAALVRRRWDPGVWLLGGGVAVALLTPLLPIHDPRHVLPLLPLLALAACAIGFGALESRPRWALGIQGLLIAAAAIHLAGLPEYRRPLDVPPHLAEAYRAVRERTPEGANILSLWTYDTFYHTGRPATWPLPWGPSRTLHDAFTTRDADSFLVSLERNGVDAILMPLAPPPERFDAANYPRGIVACVTTLLIDGRLRLVWRSQTLALVERPSR